MALRSHELLRFRLFFINLVQPNGRIGKRSWLYWALSVERQNKALSLLCRSYLAPTFTWSRESSILETQLTLLCRSWCGLQDRIWLIVWFVDTKLLLGWGFDCAILWSTKNCAQWCLEVEIGESTTFWTSLSCLFTLKLHQPVLAWVMRLLLLPSTGLNFRAWAVQSRFAFVLVSW